MCSRARVVSSLLVLLGSSFLSFKMGYTWKKLVETSLSAKFIAQISAENMEASFGRHFSS